MRSSEIYKKTQLLLQKSKTRNPFCIAEDNGLHIRFCDDFKQLKGMYLVIKKNRFIFINSNLPEYLQKIVCAHELGHDILHRHLAESAAIKEFMLYAMSSRPEYEANIVAADILLDDKEIYELARVGHTNKHIAYELNTDINLIKIKINSMNNRGYKLNLQTKPPADFLKG